MIPAKKRSGQGIAGCCVAIPAASIEASHARIRIGLTTRPKCSVAAMFPFTFAHGGMVKEGKSHHKPLDADRLFHVKIAGASADGASLLVVQTSPAWEQ